MAFRLNIDITSNFIGMPTDLQEMVAEQYAEVVAKYARDVTVPVVTGRLRRSIKSVGKYIKVQAPYAGYVEYGTKSFDGRFYIARAVKATTGQIQGLVDKAMKERLESVRVETKRGIFKNIRSKISSILSKNPSKSGIVSSIKRLLGRTNI